MADLTYKFTGVNTSQLANEVQVLRQDSSTFRALEAAAAAAGYKTIEIQMGANLLPKGIADSTRTNSSTRTIRINSDASGSWGAGGRQATVGEVIAHELAHAVVPREFSEPDRYDFSESGIEGMWVRRQAGQVARDLGLPGANNADYLITKIPINETQGCTVGRPQGDGPRDGVLFLDGSRGYNGIGSTIPPGSGSQDPINSRHLATDEAVQEFAPSDRPFPVRRLNRVTPSPIGDSPENSGSFDDRFGNWDFALAGGFSNPGSRGQQRSAAPDGPVSTSPIGESAFGDRSENTPGAPRPDIDSRRVSYGVSSAFPAITSRSLDEAVPPLERAPLLGIFSGKPMSPSLLPPSVWGLPDNSDGSSDCNSFNFLAGLALQNPTQPAPPPQIGSKPMRSQGRRIVVQPPASMVDTPAPAAPLAPSDDPDFSGGGLLGRLAAFAGIDPPNPNQPVPLDDEQEQADIRALDAKLSSSGNIRDAVALYNAIKSSRR
jgi:hypothetical protein